MVVFHSSVTNYQRIQTPWNPTKNHHFPYFGEVKHEDIYQPCELHRNPGDFPSNPIKPPVSSGFPMVFPWFSHGFPMVLLVNRLNRARGCGTWAARSSPWCSWKALSCWERRSLTTWGWEDRWRLPGCWILWFLWFMDVYGFRFLWFLWLPWAEFYGFDGCNKL